jgi:hypothetical protein
LLERSPMLNEFVILFVIGMVACLALSASNSDHV